MHKRSHDVADLASLVEESLEHPAGNLLFVTLTIGVAIRHAVGDPIYAVGLRCDCCDEVLYNSIANAIEEMVCPEGAEDGA